MTSSSLGMGDGGALACTQAPPTQATKAIQMFEPYVFRLNVLTSETSVWLGDDGFQVLEAGGTPRTYSYNDVSQVRLSYEPSRASSDLYFCRIYAKGSATPAITIPSTTYRGFLDFEPQFPAYRGLVASLHAKLAGRRVVAYRAGVSNFAYWGNVVFLSVVVVFAAILLFPIVGAITMTGLIWVKLAIIAFLAPLAAAWFWANRPRAYDPAAIPAVLLPTIES